MLGLLSVSALLAGLIVLAGYGVRALRIALPVSRTGSRLEVLERAQLAPRQGIALVRVGQRRVLLSLGDGGVRTLLELDDLPGDGETLMTDATDSSGMALPVHPFARVMRAMVRSRLNLMLLVLAALAIAPVPADAVQVAAPQGVAAVPDALSAVNGALPKLDLRLGGGNESDLRVSGTVGSVIMIGMMALIPAMLLLMTSFTRILIVMHFLRQALGTQTAPPGQLLAALALMLTGFVMAPTLERVHATAVQPWTDGAITEGEMLTAAVSPFREFMLAQTPDRDLARFIDMAGIEPATPDDVPLAVLVSAFAVSELRIAFQMGFAIFLPFVVIDLVVSAVLTSMGMFMLPPTMIALPCKLLLFVLADGWGLLVQSLVASFR